MISTVTATASPRHLPAIIALLTLPLLAACAARTRPAQERDALLAARNESIARTTEMSHDVLGRLVERAKREADAYAAAGAAHSPHPPHPPCIDVLIISGGGDWGAFGAGFLQGWGEIPASDPLARPVFDAVTGVSTGALIAPFAFLGTKEGLDRVEYLYRNPQKDWVRTRGMLYFLPNHVSFAEIPGLEREVKQNFNPKVAAEIARAASEDGAGRVLIVSATNLDDGFPQVFDLVAEARRATEANNSERLETIILASAGIPGAFPFRMIDDRLYVDGGVTGNIVYGGRLPEEQSVPALWAARYPDQKMPKLRFWVIYNNQMSAQPQVTGPSWPPVVGRSVSLAIQAATVGSIRHLHAIAEISRLKRHADVEVRVVAIPDDFVPEDPGAFVKKTMNDLADLGRKMGADTKSWKMDPP